MADIKPKMVDGEVVCAAIDAEDCPDFPYCQDYCGTYYRARVAELEAAIERVRSVLTCGHTAAYDLRADIDAALAATPDPAKCETCLLCGADVDEDLRDDNGDGPYCETCYDDLPPRATDGGDDDGTEGEGR